MRARTKAKLIAAGIGLLGLATLLDPHCYVRHYDVTITNKQIKRIDGKDTYLVFGLLDDGSPRVFKNTDSKLYWKYNSSDVNALLRADRRYRLKTVGWRWGVKSWYENILEAEPLPNLPDSLRGKH